MTDPKESESAAPAPAEEGAARGVDAAPEPASSTAGVTARSEAASESGGETFTQAWRRKGVLGVLKHLFVDGPSLATLLREAYFTFDRRTLGFTRILFGFLLFMDLFRRTPDWMYMFATNGVLPTPLNLSRPQAPAAFTILNAFSTPTELVGLWIIIFITYACVLLGYKTKLAQVLTVFWVTGLDGRVLLIENGGYVVYNLLAMWTAFLPMGDRFSLDAWLESLRRKREVSAAALNQRQDLIAEERLKPHVTFLGLVLLLQLSAIYFFNVVHKYGPAWRRDFTAVHYVLYVDRMVTPLVGAVRAWIPFWGLWLLTKIVIGSEAALAFCLLSPLAKRWARLTAVVLMNLLHVGFGTFFVLGPFAWALCVFSTLLFCREDWELAIRTMRRPHRARTVLFDPTSNGALLAARSLARLDRYELLTFEESPRLASGIAVRGPTGAAVHGATGVGEIIAALPLGPAVAWLFRVPLASSVLGAVVRLFESGRVARFFGIAHPSAAPEETGPSPVRKKGRRVLAVLRELAIFAMFTGAVNQALTELWVSRDKWNRLITELNNKELVKSQGWRLAPQPEPTRILAHKLRFLQGWFMFSPNPVMDDGTLVVDAVTVDGRHVDPFTREAPNFDLLNAKSFGYNQIWSDYYNRIRMQGNSSYREAMREFMLRLPERTGRPEDAIVSGDVYWVEDQNPKFGDPAHKSFAFKQNKLFSFDRERVLSATSKATNE